MVLFSTKQVAAAVIKLNLGCGEKKLSGYINVDKYGAPDVKYDLEVFPWPWEDSVVSEIVMIHVLEHLGQLTDVYLGIIKEIYRVCHDKAQVKIVVPHHKHQFFYDDPTHVRVVTPGGLQLFSQRQNKLWIEMGAANTPLGLYLGVDFEVKTVSYDPGQAWSKMFPDKQGDAVFLEEQSMIYNNLIENVHIVLEVVK